MAITLAAVPASNVWAQAFVLAVVGIGITVAVYGVVALIVKADDLGVALARNQNASMAGTVSRALGRGLVQGMPVLLKFLSITGTAAMVWVGGGIIVHGLEAYGLTSIGHAIHAAGDAVARALPLIAGLAAWLVSAAGAGIVALLIGGTMIAAIEFGFAPAWKKAKGLLPRRERVAHER